MNRQRYAQRQNVICGICSVPSGFKYELLAHKTLLFLPTILLNGFQNITPFKREIYSNYFHLKILKKKTVIILTFISCTLLAEFQTMPAAVRFILLRSKPISPTTSTSTETTMLIGNPLNQLCTGIFIYFYSVIKVNLRKSFISKFNLKLPTIVYRMELDPDIVKEFENLEVSTEKPTEEQLSEFDADAPLQAPAKTLHPTYSTIPKFFHAPPPQNSALRQNLRKEAHSLFLQKRSQELLDNDELGALWTLLEKHCTQVTPVGQQLISYDDYQKLLEAVSTKCRKYLTARLYAKLQCHSMYPG